MDNCHLEINNQIQRHNDNVSHSNDYEDKGQLECTESVCTHV